MIEFADLVYHIPYDCLLFLISSFRVSMFCVVVRTFKSVCSQCTIMWLNINWIMTTQFLGIFDRVVTISSRTIIYAFCTTWYILNSCLSIESVHRARTVVTFSFQLALLMFEWNFTKISVLVINLILMGIGNPFG